MKTGEECRGEEKIHGAGVVELATIITLQEANGKREVSGNVTLEVNKQAVNIRFRS